MKCPNFGGNHPAKDARCLAKLNTIAIARGIRGGSQTETHQIRKEAQEARQVRTTATPKASPPPTKQVGRLRLVSTATLVALHPGPAPDWTEDPDQLEAIMETEGETSGTVPPVAV